MIAKYKNKLFCADMDATPINIWRYDYVENFDCCVDDNLTYYEKFLNFSEIEEIFDVGFSAKWNNIYFGGWPNLEKNTMYLRTTDTEIAEKYDFTEEEHDRGQVILWYKIVPLAECEEFKFHKTIYHEKYFTDDDMSDFSDNVTILPLDEWLYMYKKTEEELSPWNYKKQ